MPRRKVPLVKNEIYHICSRSIAKFKIFNCVADYERMMDRIVFYMVKQPLCTLYLFRNLEKKSEKLSVVQSDPLKKLVEIIAYCLMPTHIHFILKELKEGGIVKFMNSILKSYSQYFNIKHKRKGPLWEGRFSNVLLENDYQFTHVTRYIHLNPVTAHLVNDPKDWKYSSYMEYIDLIEKNERLCNFSVYLDMESNEYEKFVHDHIAYQRELAEIKHLTLE